MVCVCMCVVWEIILNIKMKGLLHDGVIQLSIMPHLQK